MLEFFYWASGIIIAIILSYVTWKVMNKIKNVKIQQGGRELTDVTGAHIELDEGENIHVQDMAIDQNADVMKNVTGLSINANGSQSARLQGVQIKQPHGSITISDDPNVEVTINKQGE